MSIQSWRSGVSCLPGQLGGDTTYAEKVIFKIDLQGIAYNLRRQSQGITRRHTQRAFHLVVINLTRSTVYRMLADNCTSKVLFHFFNWNKRIVEQKSREHNVSGQGCDLKTPNGRTVKENASHIWLAHSVLQPLFP